MKNKKAVTGGDHLFLSLMAFGGLGIEVILAFLVEPILFGVQMREWSTTQNLIHWTITCCAWGTICCLLIEVARKKYSFDIFLKGKQMKLWQWLTIIACVLFELFMSYLDWNGFRVVKEFNSNGWLKFIFQYIYYIFETGLVTLIIIFGQKAFEKWFKKENIPYGGIAAALTWGLAHVFTKGDILVGSLSAVSGFIFGIVYLLVNRDIKKTFPILLVMFVL